MKKAKKVLALVLAFALTIAGTMGATIAWLHDDDAETNVFTIGNVEIDLIETPDANGDGKWDNQNAKLLPATGSAQDDTLQNGIAKEVSVKNTGSESAYVRVHIAIPQILDNGDPDFDAGKNVLHFNFDSESVADGKWNWSNSIETETGDNWNFYTAKIGDVWYNVYVVTYETALASGAETDVKAMNQVYLDSKVTNEDISRINETLKNGWNIKVVAEGAQSAGFANAYEALNTAFGTPGNYTVAWN